jgi:hypothetical protein
MGPITTELSLAAQSIGTSGIGGPGTIAYHADCSVVTVSVCCCVLYALAVTHRFTNTHTHAQITLFVYGLSAFYAGSLSCTVHRAWLFGLPVPHFILPTLQVNFSVAVADTTTPVINMHVVLPATFPEWMFRDQRAFRQRVK